jgi:hypothetical protein
LVPIQKWKSARMGTRSSLQFRNEQFFARSRKSRDCAEAYIWYTAQGIPLIDAEIAENGHFWMETSSSLASLIQAKRAGDFERS